MAEAPVHYKLPYDAELAYLKTNGLSIIDLGISVTRETRIVMDVRNVKTDVLRYHFGGTNRRNNRTTDDPSDGGGIGAVLNGWPTYNELDVFVSQIYWRGNDTTNGVRWSGGVPDGKNSKSATDLVQGISCAHGWDRYPNASGAATDNEPSTHVVVPVNWDSRYKDPEFGNAPFIDITIDFNCAEPPVYTVTTDTTFVPGKGYYEVSQYTGEYKGTTDTAMIPGKTYYERTIVRRIKATRYGTEGPGSPFAPFYDNTFPLDAQLKRTQFRSTDDLLPGDKGTFSVLRTSYSQARGFKGRLYGIRFYENSTSETPFADFYPVLKDGRPCLYERKKGQFFFATVGEEILANQGSKRYEDTIDMVMEDVTAGPVSHKHDEDFPKEYGNVLGYLPGNSFVLTGDDRSYSYKLVDSLPDFATTTERVIVLTKTIGSYVAGQVLVTDGKHPWKPIQAGTEGPGVPTDIKSFRLPQADGTTNVYIRWKDPVVTGNIGWKCTRLLRKAGAYPAGPYDGVLVAQNTEKDYHYSVTPVHDTLPAQISTVWYYKLFALSPDGGVSTSAACGFVPVEFDWTRLSSYIQSGLAPSIWGVGDVIEMGDGTPHYTGINAFYNKINWQVAGFDLAIPKVASRYPHTVTLVAKFMPNLNSSSLFDQAWGAFRLVTNEVVTGTKIYYVQNGSSYKKAVPQPAIGTIITENSGYYTAVTDDRATNGSNQWKECALRRWMNAVKQNLFYPSNDATAITTKTYYVTDTDGGFVVVPDVQPTDRPRDLGWFEIGPEIKYFTTAVPPLVAMKRIDVTPNKSLYNSIISVMVKSANNDSLTSEGAYNNVDDKICIPSITELTGEKNANIAEGERLPLFNNPEELKRCYGEGDNSTSSPASWFTRSADTSTNANVKRVTSAGKIDEETVSVKENHGILMMITIG